LRAVGGVLRWKCHYSKQKKHIVRLNVLSCNEKVIQSNLTSKLLKSIERNYIETTFAAAVSFDVACHRSLKREKKQKGEESLTSSPAFVF
jgi:hypothetical protein